MWGRNPPCLLEGNSRKIEDPAGFPGVGHHQCRGHCIQQCGWHCNRAVWGHCIQAVRHEQTPKAQEPQGLLRKTLPHTRTPFSMTCRAEGSLECVRAQNTEGQIEFLSHPFEIPAPASCPFHSLSQYPELLDRRPWGRRSR